MASPTSPEASRGLQRQGSEIQKRKRCSRVSDEILEQVKADSAASDSEDDIDKLLADLESEEPFSVRR